MSEPCSAYIGSDVAVGGGVRGCGSDWVLAKSSNFGCSCLGAFGGVVLNRLGAHGSDPICIWASRLDLSSPL
ncbi:hypothetical protein RHGRI_030618 [Rhododendron griersonianum]|uniref:Uncharacterized protein n=1 Tax=Rhododendron griersonianum TaxID=479676 RepID=A0AAV6I9D6_9ERIC|nr:hypothetical protein RHGRI_030618 [Rhododendron griersonianum]